MKKSNTPNPLKYFNDEKAKRVAKLTKAQDGREKGKYRPWDHGNKPSVEFTNPLDESREKLRKDMLSSITNRAKTNSFNQVDSASFVDPASFSKPDSSKAKEIINRYNNMNNTISNQKKGGQTKFKKK